MIDHRGSTKDINRSLCVKCRTYVDEQPACLAESKKSTAKQVENSSNIQAEAIDKLLSTDHFLSLEELKLVIHNSTAKAITVAEDPGHITSVELNSSLSDAVLDMHEKDVPTYS